MPQPPKANPARRNARVGVIELPAAGREGDAPQWPLRDQSLAEVEAWDELWKTPQAVQWEALGWARTVARYCRIMIAAESAEATAAVMGQATALEDRLGLTPKAMRLMLWKVTDRSDSASGETTKKPKASKGKQSRHLQAVDQAG